MDELYSTLLFEISIEGLEGCTYSKVFESLKKKFTDFSLDDFVSKKLLEIIKTDKENITIYKRLSTEKSKSPFTSQGYLLYSDREVATDYQDDYLLVASLDLRCHLYGLNKTNRKDISDIQYCILEEIGKQREKGAYQSEIGKKLSIDPRNNQYHLKRLEEFHLIAPRKQTVHNKTTTNITFLIKFQPETTLVTSYDNFMETKERTIKTMKQMFKETNNGIIIEKDLKIKLGMKPSDKRLWQRIKQNIQKDGLVELISVKDSSDEKMKTCFKNKMVEKVEEKKEENEETGECVGHVGERPLSYQVYEFICSHPDGIQNHQVFRHFGIKQKQSVVIANELEKFGVEKKSITSNSLYYKIRDEKDVKKKKKKEVKSDDEDVMDLETKEEKESTPTKDQQFSITKRFTRGPKLSESFVQYCEKSLKYLEEKSIVTPKELKDHLNMVESKALNRVITYLEKENQLKQMNISFPLFGATKEQKCLLKKGVLETDEIVQTFIKKLKDKSLVKAKIVHKLPIVEEKTDIKRFEEAPKAPARITKRSEFSAIKQGYITAKMLRVRQLHFHLLNLFEKDQKKIQKSDIFGQMTVGLYLRIIGLYQIIPNIQTYSEQTMDEIPKEINQLIFSNSNKNSFIIPRLNDFLKILERMKLIESIEGSKEFEVIKFIPEYKLGSISYKFDKDSIQNFWSDLSLYCVNIKSTDIVIFESNEKPFQGKEDSEILSKIHELSYPSNWSEMKKISSSNLSALKEYYEKNPIPNEEECIEISKKLRLTLETVVLFFYRYYQDYVTKTVKRKRLENLVHWKFDEDVSLIQSIGKIIDDEGKIDWKLVSQEILNRTEKECIKRWDIVKKDINYHSIIHYYIPEDISNIEDNSELKQILEEKQDIENEFINEESPSELILMKLVQMFLFTPENTWNIEVAHKLFSNYNLSDMIKVLEKFRSQGLLIKPKGKQTRLKSHKLTTRFPEDNDLLRDLRNQIEEFINVYEKKAPGIQPKSVGESFIFDEFCKGGDVAATLSLTVNGDIKLVPKFLHEDSEEPEKKPEKKSKSMKTFLINQGAIELGKDFVSGEKGYSLPAFEILIEKTKENAYEDIFEELDENEPIEQVEMLNLTENVNHINDIYEMIKSNDGITYQDLFQTFSKEDLDISLLNLINFEFIIESCSSLDKYYFIQKPKYYSFGFEEKFEEIMDIEGPTPLIQPLRKKILQMNNEKSEQIEPWTQINGELNVKFIETKKRVIFDQILWNQGISKKSLYQKLDLIHPMILDKFITEMISEKLIYEKTLTYTEPSLFKDSNIFIGKCVKNQDSLEIAYFCHPDSLLKI